MPTTDDELWDAVYHLWGIKIPRAAVCPGHVAPFTAFADAYFARGPVMIWKASRGFGGKSTLLALLALTGMVAKGTTCTLLGGSGEQSQRIQATTIDAWDAPNAPRYMLLTDPTKTRSRLTNRGTSVALTASQRSVRGPHPCWLLADEIDEMDLRILDAALGQPMSQRGIASLTVLSSTHQHPDGTMTAKLREARDRGWGQYTWCMMETMEPYGWLSQDERDRTHGRVTAQTWRIEYELQEPAAEDRAIDTASVEAMFDPALGVHAGENGRYLEFEAPQSGATYTTGTDWAKTKDWSILTTYRTDALPWRMVAWERQGRKPWPLMHQALDERIARYGGLSSHDATGMNVAGDYLEHDALDVQMVGKARAQLLDGYIKAIENGELVAPRITWAYDEHRYATHGDLYGSGHLPDSISSGALAWWGVHHPQQKKARAGAW